MKREKHYMIDIETTGVNQESDDILQVAMVEIEHARALGSDGSYWHPTGRYYNSFIHNPRQPESDFAKKHMKEIYQRCNEIPPLINLELVAKEVRFFVHENNYFGGTHMRPKFFMGWNASNFDMPFMFKKGLLTPSFYDKDPKTGEEELYGDAHYRIYEQTGSVQVLSDMTGLDRKTLETLAMGLNPTGLSLPTGKEHDALYDCYKQIIMQNGLIKIGRMGIQK